MTENMCWLLLGLALAKQVGGQRASDMIREMRNR